MCQVFYLKCKVIPCRHLWFLRSTCVPCGVPSAADQEAVPQSCTVLYFLFFLIRTALNGGSHMGNYMSDNYGDDGNSSRNDHSSGQGGTQGRQGGGSDQ